VRIRVIAGVLCLSLRAAAEESAPPSTDAVRPPEELVRAESRPAESRTVGSVIAALLTRLVRVEAADVQRVADRFARTIDRTSEDERFDALTKRSVEMRAFTRRLEEQREEVEFDTLTKRAVEMRAFTQRLEAQHEEAETREFDAHIEQFLRKSEFLQNLIREQNAARTDSRNGTVHDPARWDLYKRQ
jgi:hypothetical protein